MMNMKTNPMRRICFLSLSLSRAQQHVDALTFTMGHTSLNWAGVDVSRVAGWCGLSVAGIIEQHIARSLTRKCAPVLNNKIQELLNGATTSACIVA